jgi:hypothetical protein
MPIHRVEIFRVPDDDNRPWIVKSGIDNLTIGRGDDLHPGGIAFKRVPVLARMPSTGVEGRIFGREPVTQIKSVARDAVGIANRDYPLPTCSLGLEYR